MTEIACPNNGRYIAGKRGGLFDFSAVSHRVTSKVRICSVFVNYVRPHIEANGSVSQVLLALEHCACTANSGKGGLWRAPSLRWGTLLWGIVQTRVRYRAMREGASVRSILVEAFRKAAGEADERQDASVGLTAEETVPAAALDMKVFEDEAAVCVGKQIRNPDDDWDFFLRGLAASVKDGGDMTAHAAAAARTLASCR